MSVINIGNTHSVKILLKQDNIFSTNFISLHMNVQFLTHSSHRFRRSSGSSTLQKRKKDQISAERFRDVFFFMHYRFNSVQMLLSLTDAYTRPKAWRWCPVLTGLPRTVPHHLTVDGTAHAIMQLDIELGQYIGYIKNKTIAD